MPAATHATVPLLLRFWPVIASPALLGMVVGIVVGSFLPSKYSATAELAVGRPDVNARADAGFLLLAADLAQVFSRLTLSDEVVAVTAREAGTTPQAVREELTAVPIPRSSVFRVIGEGDDEASARRLTTAGARSAVREVNRLTGSGGQSKLSRDYRSAAQRVAGLRARLRRQRGDGARAARLRTRTSLRTAQLAAQALESNYEQVLRSTSSGAGLSVLSLPAAATSNRSSLVQRASVIGLCAGLLVGLLGATALALRAARRPGGS